MEWVLGQYSTVLQSLQTKHKKFPTAQKYTESAVLFRFVYRGSVLSKIQTAKINYFKFSEPMCFLKLILCTCRLKETHSTDIKSTQML